MSYHWYVHFTLGYYELIYSKAKIKLQVTNSNVNQL